MNKFLVSVVFAVGMIFSACNVAGDSASTSYFGSAYYDVRFADTIQDVFGNIYYSTCSGSVLFSGTFDMCGILGHRPGAEDDDALLSSRATSSDIICTFTDGLGERRSYSYFDQHGRAAFFPAGYISERCGINGPRPLALMNQETPAFTDGKLPSGITFKAYSDENFPNGVAFKRTGQITVRDPGEQEDQE